MYLEKLEINGFKSFAKKSSLEFNRGITSIVGPNGSGKSNIAEAVRWVMGEQSIKSLRGKQSTDVIFSGSDKSARLGMAEVTLVFNNSDRQANLDYSELAIGRRIHRDGHSDYFLNGQPARLQDILLLLAQINLSSKTYSVIGQGMVDEILSVTPRERKDFFEEASGVKPLQIKKNEALRKLEHTKDNLQTVNIQLSEITPRLRSLTRQVKRLERRSELENELRDLQFHYFGETFYELNTKHQHHLKEQEKLQTIIKEQETKVSGLQKIMFTLTKESSHSDKFSVSQAEYQSLIEKKSELKEQELQIKGEILQAAKSGQKTQVPISVVREVETRFNSLNQKLTDHKNKASQHGKLEDWLDWHKQLAEIIDEYSELLLPFKPYLQEHDISDKELELKNIQKALVSLEEELNENQTKIKQLAELEKKEKTQIWQTQNDLLREQNQLNQIINQRNDIRVELAKLETHLRDLESEVISDVGNEFLDRIQSWRPAKDNKINKTEQLRDDIHKLKHELELIGGIDPEVQHEYSEIKERYDFMSQQTEDLEGGVSQLEKVIFDLEETIRQQFNNSFKRINEEFKKYFRMLFRGGKAELKLIKGEADEETGEEPAAEEDKESKPKFLSDEIAGVDIVAIPPGKKIRTINMLSGGERALTSIALISAIIANNPAPFVVLDEVDAALDEENSLRFAEIVDELSDKTQFIIITHNRATMEHANLLYGVTMGDDGISKLISLKFEEAETYTNR